MKSPSLLAGRTVEISQLLFKILEPLPSFLLTNECPLVCSIAIVHCVPCLYHFFFTYVFFYFRSGTFAVHKTLRFIYKHLDHRH